MNEINTTCQTSAVGVIYLTYGHLASLTIVNFIVSTSSLFPNALVIYILIKSKQVAKASCKLIFQLYLSWRRPLSYRNQSIDLLCKSMDWFLYDMITASVMKELSLSDILIALFVLVFIKTLWIYNQNNWCRSIYQNQI